MGERGGVELAKLLESTRTLTVLRCDQNLLKDRGCTAIAKAMAQNATLRELSVVETGWSNWTVQVSAAREKRENTEHSYNFMQLHFHRHYAPRWLTGPLLSICTSMTTNDSLVLATAIWRRCWTTKNRVCNRWTAFQPQREPDK